MPLLSHLLPGQLMPKDGHSESGVRNVNPIHSVLPEQPAQVLEDAAHAFGAGSAAQVDHAVAEWATVRREIVPVEHGLAQTTEQVTAFVDKYVPIPWLHGDQAVAL